MGAPIEGRDPLGHTALMEAAKYGHANIVQELLSRGANPDATSMMGQSARTYANTDVIHQMLDQAAQARQMQEYDQSFVEGRGSLHSSAGPAGPAGLPLSLGLEQYGLQAASSSYLENLGQTAAHQSWPQSLYDIAGYSNRQAGQSPDGDVATSIASVFDQLTLGPPLQQGGLSQVTSLSHSQMMFTRDLEGSLQNPYGLSQSAPSSLQAQLSSLGLSSGAWSSQLSSAVSGQMNTSLTSLQLHQQRNGHRPVCRYWFSGRCRYGPACRFAHPPSNGVRTPAATSAPVCRYFQSVELQDNTPSAESLAGAC
ncbi:hypothetical protein WJX84_011722 [Apatococcus fuscideae]|uniref:C3H1-type domain-containing protein n=1 Tax=Apatococcus fuscideae TaxID=2026836 RepID=A0AAW1SPV7_9CHLO